MLTTNEIIQYLVDGNTKEDLARLYLNVLTPEQFASLVKEVEDRKCGDE